ncbi:MAG: T9SS type A sorting domain-containing protein [Ferruginibacter sp.]
MKKIMLSSFISILFYSSFGQLNIGNGANWVVSGNASVVLQDLNLINNGTLAAGTGKFKFAGSQNSNISGNSALSFSTLEIAKTSNARVNLVNDINIGSSVSFVSGLLDLGNSKVVLAPSALLTGETEISRATTNGTGYLQITQNLNAPNATDPGNLGVVISSSANLGSVIVRRGHIVSSGTGLTTSTSRYFDIIPVTNSNLNATLRFKYFDAEKNGLDENSFSLYQSNNSGANWSKLSGSVRNTTSNYVERVGLSRLSRFTAGVTTTARENTENTPAITSDQTNDAQSPTTNFQLEAKPKWTVGPNPNNGYFFFSIEGIKEQIPVVLFTVDGKTIGNYKVNNGQRQQVSGLKNGMYILKAAGMEAFKVLVQGSTSTIINNTGKSNGKF